MQGDVEAHKQKVRLQLCATTATSQSGKAFWSDPVQLDALGGAAVVEAPCPMTAVTPSRKEALAGYRLAVTAVQVGTVFCLFACTSSTKVCTRIAWHHPVFCAFRRSLLLAVRLTAKLCVYWMF